jgi:hypothetical protein
MRLSLEFMNADAPHDAAISHKRAAGGVLIKE